MSNRELFKFIPNKDKEPTWIPTKIVAEHFDVTPDDIRMIKKNHPELIEGVSWIYTLYQTSGGKQKGTVWSEKGRNKLAKIIQSDNAKEHRELTTIDPDRLLKSLSIIIKKEFQPIPQLVQDVKKLKKEMVHPIIFSKLLRRLSDKRLEVKISLDIDWQQIHDIAKKPTGKSKYEHMSTEEIRDAMRRLNEFLDSHDKK